MSLRTFAIVSLLLVACQPRKQMEVYNPPPPTPAAPPPSAEPAPTAAAPPGIDPGGVLGPAFTPHGLVFPPGWAMPPMPSGLPPFAMPSVFPFPTATATAPPTSTVPPPPPPAPSDAWSPASAALEDQVLAEVNMRRAQGAICGAKSMPPAPPLANHTALRTAARGHSKDMATRNYFDHTSPEGKGPKDRIMAAGWLNAGYSGENIAAGNGTASATVQQWMKSPGHCENIMDKDFKVLGVGYFANPSAKYQHYWTQNFGG
jgi:uncharacterized protein YkwD